jgi:hypothetical protein
MHSGAFRRGLIQEKHARGKEQNDFQGQGLKCTFSRLLASSLPHACFCLFVFVLLCFELRAFHLQGRCSTTWATSPALPLCCEHRTQRSRQGSKLSLQCDACSHLNHLWLSLGNRNPFYRKERDPPPREGEPRPWLVSRYGCLESRLG